MHESAPLTPQAPPAEKPQKKYRIGIVENSEQIETAAHDAADKNLTASKEELRGVSGFFKRIWKHNLFNEVYRQKEITKARAAIKASNNVYAQEGGDAKHHAAANQAIVKRFVSEYDETLHKEAGEKRETLGKTETEQAIQKKISKLIIDYAKSKTPDDAVFEAEKTRIFNELKGVKKDIIDKGDLYADNVLEIAKEVRQNIEHGKGCADLDIDFEVVVGKAKSGARTEAQFNAIDRITEKIHKSPIGRFVNEATITSAVAIAYNVGIAVSQRIASSKLAAWGTFGATALLGGGIAAARESRKLEIERKQHFREMAQGKSFDPSKSERRVEMEKSRYETRDAVSLIQGLEQTLYSVDKNGTQTLNNLDPAGIQAALKQLAEIESRIKLSDTQKIDLISYSDVKNIEGERLALDLARAKAKVDLRKLVKGGSADALLAQLLDQRTKELTTGDRGIEKKNALFKAMKKKKVAAAAIKGVATGLVVGAAAQEIVSFFNDQQHGLIEGFVNPASKTAGADPQHLTSLEFVRRYFSGELPPGGGSGGGTFGTVQEFLAAHQNNTQHIHRTLWYDNDTPKPVFDKNELKLWWGGNRGTGIDANGNYVFNMKHMLPDGSYHKNFSADAQALLQSGKLKMLFSLSQDTQNQVFEIPLDAKGNAIIDPNSEIGKVFFHTTGGHAEFLGKYAEVAQTMGSKNNVEQVRILATHVGKGVSQIELPPTTTPYIIDQPIIPIFGRTPLEKTKNITSYFDNYYRGRRGAEQFYRERRSKSLENPAAKLDHFEEVSEYLDKLSNAWKKDLISLSGQVLPMEKECRVSICIPAAGHQEGNNIYKTLEQYKDQKKKDGNPIDQKLFEINVFVNHPKDKKPDNTVTEIQRFQKDNPEMRVRMIYKALDRKDAKMGTIRKLLSDVTLLRHNRRGKDAHDLILVSNDADTKELSDRYVSNFVEKFEKHNQEDAILGKLEWDRDAYLKDPLLHIGTRLFQYLDAIHRHHKDKESRYVNSSGANFAYKSSIYAAVGGYDESSLMGEDTDLGAMIRQARKGSPVYPIGYGEKNSMVITSARRAVAAAREGLTPLEQWSIEFGPDDAFRKKEFEINGSVDLDSPTYKKKLKDGLENLINRTNKVYGLKLESYEFRKAMQFMGIKYTAKKKGSYEQINITDITKLIAGLKRFKGSRTKEGGN